MVRKAGGRRRATEMLRSDDHMVRLEAMRHLGRAGGRRAVALLADVLAAGPSDEPGMRDCRKEAARVLGEMGDWRAVPVLVDALRDDEVAEVAASALGRLDDPRSVAALAELGEAAAAPLARALHETDDPWAAVALARVADRESAEALAKQLAKGDESVNERIVRALTKRPPDVMPIVVPHIARGLNSPEARVRRFTHEQLRFLGPRAAAALPQLLEALPRTSAPGAVVRTLASMSPIDDPQVVDPVLKRLFNYHDINHDAVRHGTLAHFERVLMDVVPVSSLSRELVTLILQAATDVHRTGTNRSEPSDKAIDCLCEVVSPVTSNILHLVTRKPDARVPDHSGIYGGQELIDDLSHQRDRAKRELARRHDPPYQAEAYLDARGPDVERLAREIRRAYRSVADSVRGVAPVGVQTRRPVGRTDTVSSTKDVAGSRVFGITFTDREAGVRCAADRELVEAILVAKGRSDLVGVPYVGRPTTTGYEIAFYL